MVMPSTTTIIHELEIPRPLWTPPVIIGIFGAPCAGKTHVAKYLAAHHPLLLLSTDALRLKYGFSSGPDTLASMFQIADSLLPQRTSVVLDGIHPRAENRAEVRTLANRHGTPSYLIYVTVTRDVILQRLQERQEHPERTVSAGKFVIEQEHFERLITYLEPPTDTELDIATVDTTEGNIGMQLNRLDEQLAECYTGV